ncbi:DUF397 domain-containing protein [Actinomadura craniellae]|uniref:DUF397 domain-containing protein n=1 Tax=Actinomadura craniellae TaxID=2231787 RepID=A0A365H986_9ACTN|nr:DUF397 domain-containing protein [Actinomadura craniellae]RAY15694.1 DUF397 domain-containing protein [Actinomadura craniellae]
MNTPDLSAARWRRSSRSGDTGGNCVELAGLASHVALRDSKDPDGPALVFPAADFADILHRIKAGMLESHR